MLGREFLWEAPWEKRISRAATAGKAAYSTDTELPTVRRFEKAAIQMRSQQGTIPIPCYIKDFSSLWQQKLLSIFWIFPIMKEKLLIRADPEVHDDRTGKTVSGKALD